MTSRQRPFSSTLGRITNLGVHHVAHTGAKKVDQLLLNDRKLGQEAVLVAREDRVRESTETQCARQALELAVREDVGRRDSRDLGCRIQKCEIGCENGCANADLLAQPAAPCPTP